MLLIQALALLFRDSRVWGLYSLGIRGLGFRGSGFRIIGFGVYIV